MEDLCGDGGRAVVLVLISRKMFYNMWIFDFEQKIEFLFVECRRYGEISLSSDNENFVPRW